MNLVKITIEPVLVMDSILDWVYSVIMSNRIISSMSMVHYSLIRGELGETPKCMLMKGKMDRRYLDSLE